MSPVATKVGANMLRKADLRAKCETDLQSVLPRAAALAHIDLLDAVEKAVGHEIVLEPSAFTEQFPVADPLDPALAEIFRGPRLYKLWVGAMRKLIVSAAEVSIDDPMYELVVIAKMQGFKISTDFRAALRLAFGTEIHPGVITREMALRVDKALERRKRQRVRQSLAMLDRLRTLSAVREKGLLSDTPIGQMPHFGKNGRIRRPLPESLAQLADGLPTYHRQRLNVVYETAVAKGLLVASESPRLEDIADPDFLLKLGDVLEAEHSKQTAAAYLGSWRRAVTLIPTSGE